MQHCLSSAVPYDTQAEATKDEHFWCLTVDAGYQLQVQFLPIIEEHSPGALIEEREKTDHL